MKVFLRKYLVLVLIVLTYCASCKSTKTNSEESECLKDHFVADLRGKVSPTVLEYAQKRYGVTFSKVLDGSTNTSLYKFDSSLISLEEILAMMTESEFCEMATCYINSSQK